MPHRRAEKRKEYLKEYTKEYLLRPGIKEKIAERHKTYLTARRERYAKDKDYREKILIAQKMRKLTEEQKHNHTVKTIAWAKNKRHTDSLFKVKCNVRTRFYNWVKGHKDRHSSELVGLPWNIFRDYITVQFQPGMHWSNYGKVWHIDHIKPLALFDPTKPEEQAEAWHHTNLQPLFAADNIRKGKKYA